MKLTNNTTDGIAVPLKGGEWADIRPRETKSISNINVDHVRFKALLAVGALLDPDAKEGVMQTAATTPVNEKK